MLLAEAPGAVQLMLGGDTGGTLPPLLHPSTSLEQAVADDTLGIGFAAAGFLVFYMVGVNLSLNRLGIITPSRVRSAGSSVGALLMGINYVGMGSHDEFLQHGIPFSERCRMVGLRNCFESLDEAYTVLVEKVLKPNVSEAITGRACMVISRNTTSHPVGEAVCTYGSREEVINTLRASAFVPGWSARTPTIQLKGAPAFDGIFSQMLPCPDGVTYCIKISALPPFEPRRTFEGLLNPGELWSTLKAAAVAARGWLGTNPWKALTGAYTSGTLTKVDVRAWAKILAANLEPVADVYPGRWRRSALSPIQWFTFMLNPPDEATIRLMFAEGQADGEAWARAQGWPMGSLE